MKPLSRFGRMIVALRLKVNNVDLRIFGAGLTLITFLLIWAIVASAYLPARHDLQAGDVSEELIRAPRTLTFENKAESERRQQQAADSVARVYTFDSAVLSRAVKNAGGYFDNAARVVSEETRQAQQAATPYDPRKTARKIQESTPQTTISETSLVTLASLDAARLAELRRLAIDGIQRILEGNVTEASLPSDRERLNSVIQTSTLPVAEQQAATEIASAFLEPNNVYNNEKTQQAREQAAADVQPAIVTVRSGETIVLPGQVVTADNVAALEALGLTEAGRNLGKIAGLVLLAAIEVIILALYIRKFEKRVSDSRTLQFIIASLFILFTGVDRLAAITPLSPTVVPMAALGMLATIMLRSRLSAILVVLCSINLAVVGGSDPQFVIVGLIGGLSGTFLVTKVTQR